MRGFFLTALLFATIPSVAQDPYAKMNKLPPELRKMFDRMPVDSAPPAYYFEYAQRLLKHDSLKQAAMLFDRLYWKDTTSPLAVRALQLRSDIEKKIIHETQANLFSTWEWTGSNNGWSTTDSAYTGHHKTLVIKKDRIQFFSNDTLLRETNYSLEYRFDWIGGYLTHIIRFPGDPIPWYFTLNTPYGFTSNHLNIQQHSNYSHSTSDGYIRKQKWDKKDFY